MISSQMKNRKIFGKRNEEERRSRGRRESRGEETTVRPGYNES